MQTGQKSVNGFKCATAISSKSSNFRKKNLLMSEDPLAASKSFAIQHSLANIEQMQKDIADSKMC